MTLIFSISGCGTGIGCPTISETSSNGDGLGVSSNGDGSGVDTISDSSLIRSPSAISTSSRNSSILSIRLPPRVRLLRTFLSDATIPSIVFLVVPFANEFDAIVCDGNGASESGVGGKGEDGSDSEVGENGEEGSDSGVGGKGEEGSDSGVGGKGEGGTESEVGGKGDAVSTSSSTESTSGGSWP